ncbi:hypothetical protein HK104_004978, partial [Borealophlyctis nickersoniae]
MGCEVHRHQPDHLCPALQAGVKAAEDKKREVREFVEKSLGRESKVDEKKAAEEKKRQIREFVEQSLGREKKVEGKKEEGQKPAKRPRKLNPAIELIKMKAHAKGDTSTPASSRIYLRIHFPLDSNQPSQPMFFHK